MTDTRKERRVYLDRLRILACLSTFCYHAIQVFDLNPYYHLKSNTPSPTLDVAARLLHAVRMPLFFMIAGYVAFLALRRYTGREFLVQRAVRLLPPLFLGILLLAPIIKYYELLDGHSISWRGIDSTGGPPELLVFVRRFFTHFRLFSWSHMWFLMYLFMLSALLLPVMQAMQRAQWPSRLPPVIVLLLPVLPLVAIELVLRPIFPHHIPNLFWDWASVCVYATVMVLGAALACWPMLEDTLRRLLPASILMAAVGIALYLGNTTGPWWHVGRALTLWGTLCTLMSLAPLLSATPIPGERYLSEAALPLYVLHHPPLVVIAYHVKDLPWPVWLRYPAIVLGAFTVSLLLYHFLVRPWNWARLAFGMPRLTGAPARPAPHPMLQPPAAAAPSSASTG